MNESTETLKQRSEHPHRIAVVKALLAGGKWTQRLSYAIQHYDDVLSTSAATATALRAKDPAAVAADALNYDALKPIPPVVTKEHRKAVAALRASFRDGSSSAVQKARLAAVLKAAGRSK